MSNTISQNKVSASGKLFSAKSLYLMLVIIGSIAPWVFLFKFIAENGFSIELLIQQEFSSYGAAAFGTDLLISALVFLCFTLFELKRLGLSSTRLIIYIAATFGIGLSCGLPLFLYFREGVLENKQ